MIRKKHDLPCFPKSWENLAPQVGLKLEGLTSYIIIPHWAQNHLQKSNVTSFIESSSCVKQHDLFWLRLNLQKKGKLSKNIYKGRINVKSFIERTSCAKQRGIFRLGLNQQKKRSLKNIEVHWLKSFIECTLHAKQRGILSLCLNPQKQGKFLKVLFKSHANIKSFIERILVKQRGVFQ